MRKKVLIVSHYEVWLVLFLFSKQIGAEGLLLSIKEIELIGGIEMERPKRRKHKDNPYKLSYGNNNEIYRITFIDNNIELSNLEQKIVKEGYWNSGMCRKKI